MNIVDFYERQIMPSRQTPVAHPRAVRPGSAGKLLAMEELYNGAAITQMQAQPEYFQVKQEPATPVKQDRYGKSDRNHHKESTLTRYRIPHHPSVYSSKQSPQNFEHPNSERIHIKSRRICTNFKRQRCPNKFRTIPTFFCRQSLLSESGFPHVAEQLREPCNVLCPKRSHPQP